MVKKKRRKRSTARSIVRVLTVLLVVVVAALNTRPILKWLYPIHYSDVIAASAERHELDPFLVAALMKVESNYDSNAVSPKGAIGLLQLMPDTGRWAAIQSGYGGVDTTDLFEPEVNTHLGTWYLSTLMGNFDGNILTALAAYNAGATNVRRWLQEGIWKGDLDGLSRIPFSETRDFVERVMRIRRWYQFIYRNFPA